MNTTLIKIKKKACKSLSKWLPGNRLRIYFLKACNYRIGKDVYVGEGLIVIDDLADPGECLIIGDRVSIAPRVTLVLHSAPNDSRIRPYVKELKGKITIHQDAWIGAGAVILPDIEIGEGAVVGSNAVVTRNVPDYTIVGGVPARPIKTVTVPWRDT